MHKGLPRSLPPGPASCRRVQDEPPPVPGTPAPSGVWTPSACVGNLHGSEHRSALTCLPALIYTSSASHCVFSQTCQLCPTPSSQWAKGAFPAPRAPQVCLQVGSPSARLSPFQPRVDLKRQLCSVCWTRLDKVRAGPPGLLCPSSLSRCLERLSEKAPLRLCPVGLHRARSLAVGISGPRPWGANCWVLGLSRAHFPTLCTAAQSGWLHASAVLGTAGSLSPALVKLPGSQVLSWPEGQGSPRSAYLGMVSVLTHACTFAHIFPAL